MKLLSIIVPAYNAENYITKLLDSISSQIRNIDYEVIVVNDGSKDNTEGVVCSYSTAHPEFRCITVENGGPAHARNVGLEKASGKYIMFADSDDYYADWSIEELVAQIDKASADVLVFGFDIVGSGSEVFHYNYHPCTCTTPEELGNHLLSLYAGNMLNQVWNKVFSREFLISNDITFIKYCYGEDRLFVFSALKCAKKLLVSDKRCYMYVTQEGESLITKYIPDKFAACKLIDKNVRSIAQHCGVLDKEAEKLLNYMFLKSAVSCITTIHAPSCNLSFIGKMRYIKSILYDKNIKETRKFPANCGKSFMIISIFFRVRSAFLMYLLTLCMGLVAKLNPELFIKSKHVYNFQSSQN